MVEGDASLSELERAKLDFERYKARLDLYKFALGSVFVAIVIAAIPPSFQWATSVLEDRRLQAQAKIDQKNKEAEAVFQQQKFRDEYIKEFLTNAINQDVELRIRFAIYFSYVADDKYREHWVAYHTKLKEERDAIRKTINEMETEWQQKAQARPRDEAELDRIARNLAWAYKELGYAEKNRSVTQDPRSPTAQSQNPVPTPASEVADQPARFVVGINKSAFYSKIKSSVFSNNITPAQTRGIDAILDYWDKAYKTSDSRLLAYILATAYHESNQSMQPIEEPGKGRGTPYGVPADNGNVYYGRGLLLLTWARNYKTMGDVLGIDLYSHPELALDLNTSVAILVEGMMRGVFTGKKLSDFISGERADWINARRVVNALDRASTIAGYADRFFDALQATKQP